MDAKMHSNSAQLQSGAIGSDIGPGAMGDAGVHLDHLLAMLADVQTDALRLRAHVQADKAQANASDKDAAALKDALQQTTQQLRSIQDEIAGQQARLEALSDSDEGVSPKATGARARLADSLRASHAEQQAGRGMRAVTQLHTGAAAGSGLGDANMGHEMAQPVQVPGGEREGLDGIVTLVGGMMRASSAPTVAGKQTSSAATGWQAMADSAAKTKLKDNWGKYVTDQTRKSPESMDINQLIQWVMREAYVGNTQDLRSHATRVEYYTQLKAQLREELNRAREFKSTHRSGEGGDAKLSEAYDKQHISLDPDVSSEGQWNTRPTQPDGTTDSLEELDAYIKKLDNCLSTVGDDGQAAQLDLQNLSQKQAQLLNMLSNLSKALHDTAMSIIRKIGN